jgi:UDP-3-O-[3-hydroxymyristoyl] glucosamine N-acyltransferase
MDIKQIAKILDVEYEGDSLEITAINELKYATSSELSFVSNSKYIKDLKNSKAGVYIVEKSLVHAVPTSAIVFGVDEPYLMIAKLSKFFAPPIEDKDAKPPIIGKNCIVSEQAFIANGSVIGDNCTIMAHVSVGSNCVIEENTVLYPGVVIYRDCKVGKNCCIHANSVIGGDGFGFATSKTGEHVKIYQNGNVVIEDNVEIGSCTTIDRAALGTTLIKKGVRIDNLVQVGHNCVIGEYSVLVSQVGLSGSSTLGRNVVMGGQSATSGHLEIAPFTTLAARTGVTKSISQSGKTFSGFPMMEHKLWLKLQAKLAKLISGK